MNSGGVPSIRYQKWNISTKNIENTLLFLSLNYCKIKHEQIKGMNNEISFCPFFQFILWKK